METTNVSKNFSTNRYSDDALAMLVQHIIASMTGNTRFPTPDPTLALVQTGYTTFTTALAKAVGGTKQDTADKNAKREALVELLKKLADYVQRISAGAEVAILSSGFEVYKKPSPVGALPMPENFKVKVGINKGYVDLSCDAVAHASFYEFEYTDTPVTDASIWVKRTSTKKQLTIEGLQSGREYAFRVAAAGSHPSRQWTPAISSFVV
jgi:hypothetical protein